MDKLISIIVPVYNVGQFLARCIVSLLKQDYENIEIILVDDGSADNSGEICDAYAALDDRIRVIHKENEGLGFARNTGIDAASGEFVIFVDSDDYVEPCMCRSLITAAEKYEADAVFGGFYVVNGRKKHWKGTESVRIWQGSEETRELVLDLVGTKPDEPLDTVIEVAVWRSIYRMDVIKRCDLRFCSERELISEDLIFNIDFLLNSGKAAEIPDPVYYHSINSGSLSRSVRSDRFDRQVVLYNELYRRLSPIYPEDELRLRLGRFLIASARYTFRTGDWETRRRVLKSEALDAALRSYPIGRLPAKYALAAGLMKLYFR